MCQERNGLLFLHDVISNEISEQPNVDIRVLNGISGSCAKPQLQGGWEKAAFTSSTTILYLHTRVLCDGHAVTKLSSLGYVKEKLLSSFFRHEPGAIQAGVRG